jgi:DNA mismatch repair protein MutL
MNIQLLPDDVASQIAAGEVVERASSVVKELLENALDAGADRITIRVLDAGRKLIEVSDNGSGIPEPELSMAVARHATSKLQTAEDLFHIRTLGFRGEALASIGSVSRMEMTSFNIQDKQGSRIIIEGGKTISVKHAGVPVGTVVRVEDLFFNTPARLKFLKKDQTERQQVENLVTRYALAYPGKAIQLDIEGKTVLHTSGNGDRREVLAQVYGHDLARQLLEVVFSEGNISITGYISPISVTRSNRKEITFFVNGRWIQDTALSASLIRAYQTYIMVGRYPFAWLLIELEPEEVDVNVHPAKAEVRFRQPDLLYSLIQRAVKRALLAYSPIPRMPLTRWQNTPVENTIGDPAWTTPRINWDDHFSAVQNEPEELTQNQNAKASQQISSSIPLLRLIGQIGATYLVAEGPDGLYLIDQHAAHERVLYEKLLRSKNKVESQSLLQPEIVHVPPQSSSILEESLPILNEFGFDVEHFGANSFRVSAIPMIFSNGNPSSALRCLVEDFEEDETPLQGMIENRLIARICKRMAVKGGQTLNPTEQTGLLSDLEKCSSPRTCPHGRPTMIHLSVDLLERQFGRRGARSL